jgi:hypothetical protein
MGFSSAGEMIAENAWGGKIAVAEKNYFLGLLTPICA